VSNTAKAAGKANLETSRLKVTSTAMEFNPGNLS
jgi:hypothetical protein